MAEEVCVVSQFEFFMGMASVVMAFGLGELARFWGEMIQRANRGRVGLIRLLWTLFLMMGGVQYWTGMWAYVDLEFLFFRDVFALVLPSMLFVLACHALTGAMEDDRPDEDVYYWTNRRVIFVALVIFLVSSVAADLVLLGSDVLDWSQGIFMVLLCGVTLVVGFSEHRRIHLIWAAGMTGMTVAFNVLSPLTRLAGAS